jgi:phosphate transport system permease protein
MNSIAVRRRKPFSVFLKAVCWTAGILTMSIVIFLVGYIILNGIPYITRSLFEWEYNSTNVSLMPALINTLLMVICALTLAAPLGIFAAIWLVEYAKKGNRMVKIVRLAAETLTGVPSIVYGLFGMLLFGVYFGWGYSLLSGVFTLSIMILPLIMRTTEESLLMVPESYREGSFALGAGKLRTVFRIILPSASPGILAGIILAVGRIAGETAALIYTAGTVARIAENAFSSTRTLAVHMYLLSSEALYTNQAYATATILLVVVLCINGLSGFIAGRLAKFNG